MKRKLSKQEIIFEETAKLFKRCEKRGLSPENGADDDICEELFIEFGSYLTLHFGHKYLHLILNELFVRLENHRYDYLDQYSPKKVKTLKKYLTKKLSKGG